MYTLWISLYFMRSDGSNEGTYTLFHLAVTCLFKSGQGRYQGKDVISATIKAIIVYITPFSINIIVRMICKSILCISFISLFCYGIEHSWSKSSQSKKKKSCCYISSPFLQWLSTLWLLRQYQHTHIHLKIRYPMMRVLLSWWIAW